MKNPPKYKDVKGTVVIGAFDFDYNDHNWVVRGNFDYGHLGDADLISTHNKSQDNSTQSPYPHTRRRARQPLPPESRQDMIFFLK